MEFEVERKELQGVLGVAQGISDRRSILPILSNVLLGTKGELLNVEATDLEVFLSFKVQAEVKEEGETCVNARKLYEITKEIDEDTLKLKVLRDLLVVQTERGQYELPTMPTTDFPRIEDSKLEDACEVGADVLEDLVDKTLFATATETSRYALTGVLVEGEEGILRLVASDGHRLSMCESKVERCRNFKILVPRSGMSELRRTSAISDIMKVKISANSAKFESKLASVHTKLIEEEFPDYREIIPDAFKMTFVTKTKDMIKAVRRVAVFSPSKLGVVNMEIGGGKAYLACESSEFGQGKEYILGDTRGERTKIAFSSRYLIDALNAVNSELVSLRISGEASPCLIEPVGGFGAAGVVMPVRL